MSESSRTLTVDRSLDLNCISLEILTNWLSIWDSRTSYDWGKAFKIFLQRCRLTLFLTILPMSDNKTSSFTMSTNRLWRAIRAWLCDVQRVGDSRSSVMEQVRSFCRRFHLMIALKKMYSLTSMSKKILNSFFFTASLLTRYQECAA